MLKSILLILNNRLINHHWDIYLRYNDSLRHSPDN
jgi:hypothetical protein